jgi:antitoxin VapB
MRAKIFMNGRSQAVRLPKEFRFKGEEVSIRKEGDTVILEPIRMAEWPEGYFESILITDDTFDRPEQPITPDIEPLG